MSTAPIEDDRPRTLIPSKLGKQAGGIRGTPKTPCSRKVGAVEAAEAEVISSDDDFEKIAYPKNGKSAAGTVAGRGGKNAVITRRKPTVESGIKIAFEVAFCCRSLQKIQLPSSIRGPEVETVCA